VGGLMILFGVALTTGVLKRKRLKVKPA